MQIVIAEDTVLLREGLAGLLEDAGHEVVARVGDAEALLAVVAEHEPDLAVVDVRMPPDYEYEGMRAAAEIEAAAYFVVCEAVTNAVKHGSPSRVRVETMVANGALRLVVADDGIGGAAAAKGTGLVGLTDRVEAQGGTLLIDSPPGVGTRIEAEIPCG